MKLVTLAGLALAMAALAACGGGSDPIPDFPDAAPRPDATIDAAIDAPASCFDPTGTPVGCYLADVCEPTEDEQFLNSCTDGSCTPFDNAARLPLWQNGELPPLP